MPSAAANIAMAGAGAVAAASAVAFGSMGAMAGLGAVAGLAAAGVAGQRASKGRTSMQLALYDTIHGKYDGTVEVDGDSLVIDGQKVALSHTRDPAEIPFGETFGSLKEAS
eukprot:s219_g15.t1